MNIEDKIKSISDIDSDLKYLKDEYQGFKLWGNCPDGDVKFGKLLEWLHENQHNVEHMILVANKIQELEK